MIDLSGSLEIEDDATADLLDTLLPEDGYVVVMVRAFFDESFGSSNENVLCVAGYVFRKKECRALAQSWRIVLRRYGLPFFRMSACAHGARPFDKLTMNQRIAVETECIGLIKQYAAHGFAVSTVPRIYDTVVREENLRSQLGGAYSFLTRNALIAISTWGDQVRDFGKVAYVFEAGHKSQGEANGIMNRMFKLPGERSRFRYSSHSFVEKADSTPLQAADLLAWQWFTDCEKRRTGKWTKPRADLRSLVEAPHHVVDWTKERLEALVRDTAELVRLSQ